MIETSTAALALLGTTRTPSALLFALLLATVPITPLPFPALSTAAALARAAILGMEVNVKSALRSTMHLVTVVTALAPASTILVVLFLAKAPQHSATVTEQQMVIKTSVAPAVAATSGFLQIRMAPLDFATLVLSLTTALEPKIAMFAFLVTLAILLVTESAPSI
jgi:hypothetical protein